MLKKDWPATRIVQRKVADLVPYANNARTHSDEQIDQIAASIEEFGWTIPILIDEDGGVIAGHGRLLAAERIGIKTVPAMTAKGWTDAQKRAYVIADNKLALNAGWDLEKLSFELGALDKDGFDLSLTGFEKREIADLFLDNEGGHDPNYSRKIEPPIYKPRGDRPKPSELYDASKSNELKAEIAKANIPDDIRAFLIAAADRHTVFDFENIAEFYAHADPETQALFERSALVIIDINQAIEQGFVRLTKGILEQAEASKARNHA